MLPRVVSLQCIVRCVMFASSVGLVACSGHAEEAAHGGMPPPSVTTFDVVAADLPVSNEYVGRTAGSREVEIRARVSGILEKRFYQEGAEVAADAPLFLIDPKPYQAKLALAEADLARGHARHDQAERELARLKPLAASNATSARDYDNAKANLALALADVQAAEASVTEARLNLGYTQVKAPIKGISGEAMMVEGALVTAGDSLLTRLVQADPMYVHFSISENDWLQQQRELSSGVLRNSADGRATVQVKLADGRLLPQQGEINFRDVRIDTATNTVAMRASLPNSDAGLKAGQFVRVVVSGGVRPNAITVPQRAVLEGPHGKFVYVAVLSDDQSGFVAHVKPVDVGEWLTLPADQAEPQRWLIHSGLQSGDRVIVDNLIKIRPDAPIQVATAPAAQP